MQTYQSTPDYYRDFISHADHKYISKHRGPSGKWVYVYNNESQRSAYKDRKKQIKEGRETADHLQYENQKRKKYAYADRARQVKEGRERASIKSMYKSYKGSSFYKDASRRHGFRDDSTEQAKTLSSRTSKRYDLYGKTTDRVGSRLTTARGNAKQKYKTNVSLTSTTKGYGKSSTQPSNDALKNKSKIKRERDARIRFRNAAAAERARKNRKAK